MGGRAVFSGYPLLRSEVGSYGRRRILKVTRAIPAPKTFCLVVRNCSKNEAGRLLLSLKASLAQCHVTPRSFPFYAVVNASTPTSISTTLSGCDGSISRLVFACGLSRLQSDHVQMFLDDWLSRPCDSPRFNAPRTPPGCASKVSLSAEDSVGTLDFSRHSRTSYQLATLPSLALEHIRASPTAIVESSLTPCLASSLHKSRCEKLDWAE